MNDFKITHGIWAHHTFGLLTCELFIFLKWIFIHQCYPIVLNPQPFFKKKKEFQRVFISRFYWCMTPPPIATPKCSRQHFQDFPRVCFKKWQDLPRVMQMVSSSPLVLICPLPRLVRPQSKDSGGSGPCRGCRDSPSGWWWFLPAGERGWYTERVCEFLVEFPHWGWAGLIQLWGSSQQREKHLSNGY